MGARRVHVIAAIAAATALAAPGAAAAAGGRRIAFESARDDQEEIYVTDADGGHQRRVTDNPARDESPDWQAVPFGVRGHRRCGDVSIAAGGASSVVARGVRCAAARTLARRWTSVATAHRAAPPKRVRGARCTTARQTFDLRVVRCRPPRPRGTEVAFVWRPAG